MKSMSSSSSGLRLSYGELASEPRLGAGELADAPAVEWDALAETRVSRCG